MGRISLRGLRALRALGSRAGVIVARIGLVGVRLGVRGTVT